jgi:hypothetical protein
LAREKVRREGVHALVRPLLHRLEQSPALGGERYDSATAVVFCWGAPESARALESRHEAADVAEVEAERLCDLADVRCAESLDGEQAPGLGDGEGQALLAPI